MADEVYVVNVGGYIGERTAFEIEYAEKQGKYVYYYAACKGGGLHAEADWEWKTVVTEGITVVQGWCCPECGLVCAEKRCLVCD